MAQSMSGVVLGGVAEVVGSNLARGKIYPLMYFSTYFQVHSHLSLVSLSDFNC